MSFLIPLLPLTSDDLETQCQGHDNFLVVIAPYHYQLFGNHLWGFYFDYEI